MMWVTPSSTTSIILRSFQIPPPTAMRSVTHVMSMDRAYNTDIHARRTDRSASFWSGGATGIFHHGDAEARRMHKECGIPQTETLNLVFRRLSVRGEKKPTECSAKGPDLWRCRPPSS